VHSFSAKTDTASTATRSGSDGPKVRSERPSKEGTAACEGGDRAALTDRDHSQFVHLERRAAAPAPTLHTIPVGKGPVDLVAGEGAVWVANGLDGTVSRIDPTTYEVVATIRVSKGLRHIAAGEASG
jgi:YVTN family beta-propeller protein